MGPFVSRAFEEQGVRTAIEATGLPRFAALFARKPLRAPEPRRALYLTGSFAWHDERALAECQRREIAALGARLPAAGWRLRVRVHPREDPLTYAPKAGVEISNGAATPLEADVAASEVVVTAMSTAALEALALGRPVVVHLGEFPAGLADLSLGSHPGIPVTRKPEALVAMLERLREDPPDATAILADFCAAGTSHAARAIADSLAAGVRARRNRDSSRETRRSRS
jgi:hypothetical protein